MAIICNLVMHMYLDCILFCVCGGDMAWRKSTDTSHCAMGMFPAQVAGGETDRKC